MPVWSTGEKFIGLYKEFEADNKSESPQTRDLIVYPLVTSQDSGASCNPIASCLLQVHFVMEEFYYVTLLRERADAENHITY